MVVPLGSPQQVELDEAGHLPEMTLAPEPDLLEILRGILDDLKSIHRNKHDSPLVFHPRTGLVPPETDGHPIGTGQLFHRFEPFGSTQRVLIFMARPMRVVATACSPSGIL